MSPKKGRLKIQVGLAVNPNKAVYIVRQSDEELLSQLQRGEYCNVLCSRQMGKTSLLHRTRSSLASKKIHSALIDVAGSLGLSTSSDDWYLGLLQMVAGELGLSTDVREWWRASPAATANQRLIQFFREEVLGRLNGRVVIFFDEIDSTLSLPFTDDLFFAIRWMYSERAREPAFGRLSFCLVGVATPNELIKADRTTPYNVGRTIELRDFDADRDDLRPFEEAISDDPKAGRDVVQAVLRWTGGHPYLTARLCEEFLRMKCESAEDVDRLVEGWWSNRRELERDIHFEPILRFMKDRVDDRFAALHLYRRALRGRREPDGVAPAQIQLKLAGILKRDDSGMLVVRNELYRRVFTDRWAKELLPGPDQRWLAAAVIGLLLGSAGWGLQFINHKTETLKNALDDYVVARSAYRSLGNLPLFGDRANELWAEFWERRAQQAELKEDRDQALLCRLEAQAVHPTPERATRVRDLFSGDDEQLLATFHIGRGPPADSFDITIPNQNVAISPDGSKVLTGGYGAKAQLWSLDGSPIGQPMTHSGVVRLVAFSRDGSKVLTGSDDGTAHLWSARDGSPIGQSMPHGKEVRAVAFSPDGSLIVTGSEDGIARLWSGREGTLRAQLKHDGPVRAVAFSPDGSMVVTASLDNTARLWSSVSGAPIGVPMRHEHGPILTVAFSPDGKLVATGSLDKTLRLWKDGRPVGHPVEHADTVNTLAFSPDGSKLVTGSSKTAQLWNTSDLSPAGPPMRHGGVVSVVSFSSDGTRVLTGGLRDPVRLWSTADGKPLGLTVKHSSPVVAATFSPDGLKIVSSALDGTARLWNLAGGVFSAPVIQTGGLVHSVAFSPDGSRVVVGGDDKRAQLWSTSGASIGEPMVHEGAVLATAFTPDDSRIITGSADNYARLWSARDGSAIAPPIRHDAPVSAVAASPDGLRVVTGSKDGKVRLWWAASAAPYGRAIQHAPAVNAVAISSNDTTVTSVEASMYFWRFVLADADAGVPQDTFVMRRQPLIHPYPVTSFALSPDGSIVLEGLGDGTVRLWSTDEAVEPPTIKHSERIQAVAYSKDGARVFTATTWWVHVFDVSSFKGPVVSLFLPAPFKAFQPTDDSGSRARVAVGPTHDSIQLLELRVNPAPGGRSPEDPVQLLQEWQRRLGLRLSESGSIEYVQ